MATTTIKTLVVETPVLDSTGAVTGWTSAQAWGFTTAAEREALAPTARQAAKECGGRLVLLTETDDGAGTTTAARKVLLDRTGRSLTIVVDSLTLSRFLRFIPDEPWAQEFLSAAKAALGGD